MKKDILKSTSVVVLCLSALALGATQVHADEMTPEPTKDLNVVLTDQHGKPISGADFKILCSSPAVPPTVPVPSEHTPGPRPSSPEPDPGVTVPPSGGGEDVPPAAPEVPENDQVPPQPQPPVVTPPQPPVLPPALEDLGADEYDAAFTADVRVLPAMFVTAHVDRPVFVSSVVARPSFFKALVGMNSVEPTADKILTTDADGRVAFTGIAGNVDSCLLFQFSSPCEFDEDPITVPMPGAGATSVSVVNQCVQRNDGGDKPAVPPVTDDGQSTPPAAGDKPVPPAAGGDDPSPVRPPLTSNPPAQPMPQTPGIVAQGSGTGLARTGATLSVLLVSGLGAAACGGVMLAAKRRGNSAD